MSTKLIIKLVILFIGLVMPILGMLNCKGFNEGSMKVKECFFDNELFKSYASFYFGWITISSFMMFIPVIIYIFIVFQIAKFVSSYF